MTNVGRAKVAYYSDLQYKRRKYRLVEKGTVQDSQRRLAYAIANRVQEVREGSEDDYDPDVQGVCSGHDVSNHGSAGTDPLDLLWLVCRAAITPGVKYGHAMAILGISHKRQDKTENKELP